MDWRSLDLNLLVVSDAVLRDGGVASAASRLNMSPSAASHANRGFDERSTTSS